MIYSPERPPLPPKRPEPEPPVLRRWVVERQMVKDRIITAEKLEITNHGLIFKTGGNVVRVITNWLGCYQINELDEPIDLEELKQS